MFGGGGEMAGEQLGSRVKGYHMPCLMLWMIWKMAANTEKDVSDLRTRLRLLSRAESHVTNLIHRPQRRRAQAAMDPPETFPRSQAAEKQTSHYNKRVAQTFGHEPPDQRTRSKDKHVYKLTMISTLGSTQEMTTIRTPAHNRTSGR